MAGQNVPLMLTQGITVTNDSLVHFMPDTTPRAAKKVYLVFLSLSAVWTLGVWGAAGELIHDLRSKLSVMNFQNWELFSGSPGRLMLTLVIPGFLDPCSTGGAQSAPSVKLPTLQI